MESDGGCGDEAWDPASYELPGVPARAARGGFQEQLRLELDKLGLAATRVRAMPWEASRGGPESGEQPQSSGPGSAGDLSAPASEPPCTGSRTSGGVGSAEGFIFRGWPVASGSTAAPGHPR